jgi:hypothetical protein
VIVELDAVPCSMVGLLAIASDAAVEVVAVVIVNVLSKPATSVNAVSRVNALARVVTGCSAPPPRYYTVSGSDTDPVEFEAYKIGTQLANGFLWVRPSLDMEYFAPFCIPPVEAAIQNLPPVVDGTSDVIAAALQEQIPDFDTVEYLCISNFASVLVHLNLGSRATVYVDSIADLLSTPKAFLQLLCTPVVQVAANTAIIPTQVVKTIGLWNRQSVHPTVQEAAAALLSLLAPNEWPAIEVAIKAHTGRAVTTQPLGTIQACAAWLLPAVQGVEWNTPEGLATLYQTSLLA